MLDMLKGKHFTFLEPKMAGVNFKTFFMSLRTEWDAGDFVALPSEMSPHLQIRVHLSRIILV